ncbi:hypothetical protein H0H93_010313 [Arthromyces matolae]|nr:hypothetical protein H0H93_010313 [Arthromyces matolae]
MDPLKKSVQIKVDQKGELEFQNVTDSHNLEDGQISAENVSQTKAGVAVGFLKGTKFSTAAFIGGLTNMTSWTVTYKPDLTLWISSDGVSGQTFESISVSTEAIHTWRMTDDTDVPNNSRWVLYQDEHSSYRIKLQEDD